MEGGGVEVCFLDFQKAFDSVTHRLLGQKVAFGVGAEVNKWIA